MADSASVGGGAHPAPHRHWARRAELGFANLAPLLAWSLHLVINYAFASWSCYPDRTPRTSPLLSGLWTLLVAVDAASLVISAVATLVAYRIWQATAEEMQDTRSPLGETGEGRTRFLAIWGVLIGSGFFLAVLFDFVGLWIVPICG